jgi:prepilin-type N-terminal cleavage/methylation domain-containing protein
MTETRRRDAGFTLTELMIAISIIGLIAVLAMPNYNRFMQDWRLNGEAQQFASTLRTARSKAVMKNIDVVFTFDMDNNTYFYYEDMNRDGNRDSDEFRSTTYAMSPGIAIVGNTLSSTILTFGSKGNTRESGMITLRNSNRNNKNIRIFGGTGNVTLE